MLWDKKDKEKEAVLVLVLVLVQWRRRRNKRYSTPTMLVVESSGANVNLPEELVQVLPSDPFEQLDVARKITSIALSTRVDALQSESSALRAELADKDGVIAELQAQVESLHAALSEAAEKLALADQDKVPTASPKPGSINLHEPFFLFLNFCFTAWDYYNIIGEFGKEECFAFQHSEEAQQRCLQGKKKILNFQESFFFFFWFSNAI